MDMTEFTNSVVQAIYGSIDNAFVAVAPFIIVGLVVCIVKAILNKISNFFFRKLNG